MEQAEKFYDTDDMNDETYNAFVVGMKAAIDKSGYSSQRDFAAVAGIPPETLSKHINQRQRMREDTIQKYVECLKISEADIVMLGRDVLNKRSHPPQDEPPPLRQTPGVEAGWVEPMDVLSMVSSAVGVLAKQSQDESGRKRFWREIFDVLPMATMVIKDGLIWYQNEKSRDWGNLKGVTLCDSCVCPEDCKKKHECPSFQAVETKTPRSGHQFIGSKYYKVDVVPLRNNYKGHQYFVILAAEEKEQPPDDRRSGVDRRTESFLPG